MTFQQWLQRASAILQATSTSARLDAELLLAHILHQPRSHLFAWPESRLSPTQQHAAEALLQRRQRGEPIAYIRGVQEFWSLAFAVNPSVLVPRPETELLVELALDLPAQRVLELGTGSGAIATVLAYERPHWTLVATDRSLAALATAQHNLQRHSVQQRVQLLAADWYAPLRGHFDLIVSNPPYVGDADPHLSALWSEPRTALCAGEDGLRDLRRIIAGAKAQLAPKGQLMVEHGADQSLAVQDLMYQAGGIEIKSYRDPEGRWRVTSGCWQD